MEIATITSILVYNVIDGSYIGLHCGLQHLRPMRSTQAGSLLKISNCSIRIATAIEEPTQGESLGAHTPEVRSIMLDFDIWQERSCKVSSLDTNLNWVGVRE
jgi:hypothetical protein